MEYSWAQTMASETTAAATARWASRGAIQWPCCLLRLQHGGLFWALAGDGEENSETARIFHVNWFRKGADGKFLWPGYGENVRVLKWILERVKAGGGAGNTIGYVPAKNGLTMDGMKISDEAVNEMLRVDPEDWELEMEDSKQFLAKFGARLPRQISEEQEKLARRFQRVVSA